MQESTETQSAKVTAAGVTSTQQPLRRQFSWTLPATAIYGACNLLLVVVLNKFGSEQLGMDGAETNIAAVGRFGLAFAVTGPFFLFANLRFGLILGTDVQSKASVSDYFIVRAWLIAAAVGVFVCALLWGRNSDIAVLAFLVACAKSAESFSDLCCGVQQRLQRMDRIAISFVANGVAMTLAFGSVFIATRNLTLATLALCVARIAVLVIYDLRQAHFAGIETGQPLWAAEAFTLTKKRRLLFLTGAPLGITAALISLTSNTPKYLLPVMHSEAMLGLFITLAGVLQAGNLVFRAIELPAAPRLSTAIAQRDAGKFWKLLGLLCSIFFVIGLVGCIFSLWLGGPVLSALFTPSDASQDVFATMGGLLALMIACTAFSQVAGMIESSMIAARMTAVQIPMHCLTAICCLVLSWLMIPKLELVGAVLAVTFCRFPFMVLGVLFLRQKLAEPKEHAELEVATEPVRRRAA